MGIFRLLLALYVVAANGVSFYGLSFIGGPLAVQAFFIISGFYITFILNEKYVNVNNNYSLFITNRFLRLYPIYWSVLCFVILSNIFVFYRSKGINFHTFQLFREIKLDTIAWIFVIFSNLFIFFQDFSCFLGINQFSGSLYFTNNFHLTNPWVISFQSIPQAWSISLELFFYKLAPFIVKLNWKFVLTILCFSFLIKLYIFNYLNLKQDPWSYRFFPTEILYFLLGFFSYKLFNFIRFKRINIYFEILFYPIVLFFTLFKSKLPELNFNLLPYPLFDLFYLIIVSIAIPFLFLRFKSSKIDTKIGELSYPVYISHVFLIDSFHFFKFKFLENDFIKIIMILFFSYLLNKLIAEPIEKFRQNRLVR